MQIIASETPIHDIDMDLLQSSIKELNYKVNIVENGS